MAHVQLAARVREHRKAIEGLLAWLFTDDKGFLRIPVGLRGGFNFARLILIVHGGLLRILACGKRRSIHERADPRETLIVLDRCLLPLVAA